MHNIFAIHVLYAHICIRSDPIYEQGWWTLPIAKCHNTALLNETFEMSKAQCQRSCDHDFEMYTYTTRNVCVYN